ncbi:hypothetical protein E8E12_000313 [Didymella heteroderae]|uniref:Uncharacterized protein n=1 Tax=Didymella heteroderae TaxID=1769908 RepID=A0A9P4WHD9_9PLEO|nr:hypothetical protein E8E12_000313 [Didymella heteroderae]
MKENGKSSEMVKPFLFHFREKVNKYRQLLSTWGNSSGVFFERANHMKGRVWIYHKGDDLPSEVERRIDGLSEMVDELQFVCSQLNERDLTRSTVRDHLNGCLDDAIGDISLPVTIMTHGLTFEDGEEETVPLPESMPPHYTKLLKREWSRAGLEDDMLREFLTFTLINEMPYENRSKIYMVVREALNLDRDGPKQIYGDDFRIMSGIMPNKKKVQLVFDKANDRHPIYTILKFYATHVMQGICGTAGVHMYYGTAQNLQSLVLDFSGDERQDAANSAIEKYKPLGWKFQDMDREATRARDMSDLDTKVIDFESLYATALSEVDKGQVLPDDISSFFVRKRKELRSVTWNERYGCIPDDEIKSSYSKGRNWERDSKIQTGSEMEADEGARFVRWVHEKLSGHKHVVPRTKWESQDIFDAKLDVFFAGFHSVR